MSAFRIIRRIADLFDVDTTGAVDGDALTYDAGSEKWVPGAVGEPDDQIASEVPFTPAGSLAATDVQDALEELDAEKAALAHAHDGGDITTGTVADARIASTIARDSEVTSAVSAEATARDAAIAAHTGDATAAHAASAIAFTPAGSISATDVQAAIEEAVSEVVTGAPTGADYLVGTANGGLSAEIVVGTSPGGELGGTWASPTVDATHSGSSHAAVQAAAEATAAAALSAHEADTTAVHGITDTSALVTTSRTITAGAGLTGGGTLAADRTLDVQVDGSTLEIASDTVRVKDGGVTPAKLSFDPATQTELDAHISDASAAHAASAVSVSSATLSGTGTDVQASLEEIDNLLDDHSARHAAGGADEVTVTVAQIDAETSDFGQVPTSDGAGGVTWEDQSGGVGGSGTAADTTFSPAGNIAATDVQAAIQELDTEKQPVDSDLTAIAALSPTNDDVIQRKAGAWTNRTLAQLIADLAALGTTFQPLDSDLTAFAGLSIAADKLPYGNGSHTLALADLTAAGRALLDDADASAQLTTLGLSTFVKTLMDDSDASTFLGTLGVTTFIKTLLDDADAATARATLGIIATRQVPITLTAPDSSGNGYGLLVAPTNFREVFPAFLKDVDGDWWGYVRVPKDYGSAGKIILRIMANSTAGQVSRMLVATKQRDTAATWDAALTAETAVDTTLSTTAYRPSDVSFTLSTTPVAGEDLLVKIQHNGAHANDTLAVDTILAQAVFEYTIG